MLIWSPKGRAAAGVVASVLFIVFFFLPLAVIGCPICQPHDWLLRQPVCAALRRLGGAGAASIWGENAEMVKYGVLSAECDSVSVRGPGHSGCFQPGAIANERHPMDCADSALCADFRLYLQ